MPSQPIQLTRRADLGAVAFALAFPSALTFVYFKLLADTPPAVQHTAYGVLKLVQFGFPLFWYLKVQRRTLSFSRPSWAGLFGGIVVGLTVLAAMWVLYQYVLLPNGLMDATKDPVRKKIEGFGVDTLPAYAALGAFYSLVHSLLEEYYWRWFVFAQLRRLTSMPTAVVVSSLGFMAHHVILLGTFFGFDSPLCWVFSLAVAVGGAIWAWMYERWQSLVPVWISHLLVDVGIFWIGYDLAKETF